jgi:hypothetical protein
MRAEVPAALPIVRWRLYGGLGCTVTGTFVRCRLGDLAREQQATVRLSVRGTRRGTWMTEADVDALGSMDSRVANAHAQATLVVR